MVVAIQATDDLPYTLETKTRMDLYDIYIYIYVYTHQLAKANQ